MDKILSAFIGDTTPIRVITNAGGAGFVGMVADVTDGILDLVDGKSTQWLIATSQVAIIELAQDA